MPLSEKPAALLIKGVSWQFSRKGQHHSLIIGVHGGLNTLCGQFVQPLAYGTLDAPNTCGLSYNSANCGHCAKSPIMRAWHTAVVEGG